MNCKRHSYRTDALPKENYENFFTKFQLNGQGLKCIAINKFLLFTICKMKGHQCNILFTGNVGDLVKYMLLGTDKNLEKKKESCPPLQSK